MHDAIHWLQNVEDKVYDDLAEGAVELVIDVDSITAVVSADIMKAVNGVEQELNEVVSTIEEYASVVANVIVTIVEQSFLHKLIEDIIALISLFQHLKDIKALANSLSGRSDAILSGPVLLPDNYSSWDEFQSYFGVNTNLADQMNNLDVSSVVTEVTTDVLDAISKNPMTGKVLNKLLSSLVNAIEEDLPNPPVSFTPNDAVFDAVRDDIAALETDLITAFADLTGDVVEDAITQMSDDLANPQDTYKNLSAGLETLVAQVDVDVIKPVLDWADDVIRSGPSLVRDTLDQNPLITVDLTALKDLLDLFGIGKQVNGTYGVSTADAVFIPMAVIMWEALYTTTGKSISSIDELDSASSTAAPDFLTGTTGKTDFNLANLAVNFVATEIGAGSWFLSANKKVSGEAPSNLRVLQSGTNLINVIRRTCNLVNFVYQNADSDGDITGNVNQVEIGFAYGQLFLSTFGFVTQLSDPDSGGGASAGWPTKPSLTDILAAVATLGTTGTIAYNVYETSTSKPSDADIVSVTGQSLARSQSIATFVWDFIVPADEEVLPFFAAYIAAAPYGFLLQAAAASGALGAPGRGHGSCPRNKGKGKGRP